MKLVNLNSGKVSTDVDDFIENVEKGYSVLYYDQSKKTIKEYDSLVYLEAKSKKSRRSKITIFRHNRGGSIDSKRDIYVNSFTNDDFILDKFAIFKIEDPSFGENTCSVMIVTSAPHQYDRDREFTINADATIELCKFGKVAIEQNAKAIEADTALFGHKVSFYDCLKDIITVGYLNSTDLGVDKKEEIIAAKNIIDEYNAEEEARMKAEMEAMLKAEEEARKKVEEEARKKAEEEARIKAEDEATATITEGCSFKPDLKKEPVLDEEEPEEERAPKGNIFTPPSKIRREAKYFMGGLFGFYQLLTLPSNPDAKFFIGVVLTKDFNNIGNIAAKCTMNKDINFKILGNIGAAIKQIDNFTHINDWNDLSACATREMNIFAEMRFTISLDNNVNSKTNKEIDALASNYLDFLYTSGNIKFGFYPGYNEFINFNMDGVL